MRNRILLLVIPAVVLFLAFATGFSLVWRFFFLSVALLLVSYIWAFFNVIGIDAGIKPQTRLFNVGDLIDQEVTLLNRGKLPRLLVGVCLKSSLAGQTRSATLGLLTRRSSCWQTTVMCVSRGQHVLGPVSIVGSDPFGLFNRHRTVGKPQSITVCPRTVELPFFSLYFGESSSSKSPWLVNQSGISVVGVREAGADSSLSHIHWPSSVHAGKLMVKLFEPERSRSSSRVLWIVLDMHGPAHAGCGADSTEEYAITIAASLAKKYLGEGWSVGMMASGERAHFFSPRGTAEEHLSSLMVELATMKAAGTTPVDDFLTGQSAHFGPDCAVIVITSDNEKLASPLRKLAASGRPVAAILLDSATFGTAGRELHPLGALTSSGVQVYVVRRGDDLGQTLGRAGRSAALRDSLTGGKGAPRR